jgi:hypothetical protein
MIRRPAVPRQRFIGVDSPRGDPEGFRGSAGSARRGAAAGLDAPALETARTNANKQRMDAVKRVAIVGLVMAATTLLVIGARNVATSNPSIFCASAFCREPPRGAALSGRAADAVAAMGNPHRERVADTSIRGDSNHTRTTTSPLVCRALLETDVVAEHDWTNDDVDFGSGVDSLTC